jgi:hypothetical protein
MFQYLSRDSLSFGIQVITSIVDTSEDTEETKTSLTQQEKETIDVGLYRKSQGPFSQSP